MKFNETNNLHCVWAVPYMESCGVNKDTISGELAYDIKISITYMNCHVKKSDLSH